MKEKIIPEDIIKDRLKNPIISEITCPNCNKEIEVLWYPYYCNDDNEVVYVTLCPHCDELLFSKD